MPLSKNLLLVVLAALVSTALYAQEKECVAKNGGFALDKQTGEVANANRALQVIKSCIAENPNPKAKTIADRSLPKCQAWATWVGTKKENEATKMRAGCKDDLLALKAALSEPAASAPKPAAPAAAANAFKGYEDKLAGAKSAKQKELAAQIAKFKEEYNKNCASSAAAPTCSVTKAKLSPLMAQFNAAGNAGAQVLKMPTKHR